MRNAPGMSLVNHKRVFGHGAGLDFSTAVPTPVMGFAINTFEGCASISDANGNLLFYTDGVQVWDSAGTSRISGLHGHTSSTQSAAIVPVPGSAQEYYVFTADGPSGAGQHLNGIRLDVTNWSWQALPALSPSGFVFGTERLAVVRHANCRDYWIITVVWVVFLGPGTGAFRIFRATSGGVRHVGDVPLPQAPTSGIGYLRASPDGTRLALADFDGRNVTVCRFNNANGTITTSNAVVISAPGQPVIPSGHPKLVYGVEFSPSGRFLYFSVLGDPTGTAANTAGYVFQVDLAGTPTPQLVIKHPNAGGRRALAALQLGPDGRIYVAKDGESGVGAILDPDVPGAACNPDMSFITFPGSPPAATCYGGLPSHASN